MPERCLLFLLTPINEVTTPQHNIDIEASPTRKVSKMSGKWSGVWRRGAEQKTVAIFVEHQRVRDVRRRMLMPMSVQSSRARLAFLRIVFLEGLTLGWEGWSRSIKKCSADFSFITFLAAYRN